MESVGRLAYGIIFHLGGDDLHGERRQGHWPDNAVLVMALLDGSRQRPRNADPVTSHFQGLLLALTIEKRGSQRFGVFCSQEEDLTRLDAAMDSIESLLAARTAFAVLSLSQISKAGLRGKVACGADIEEVRVGFVGARHGRLHCLQSCVGDNSDRVQTDRASESNRSPGHFLHNLRAGQSERIGLEQAAELGFGNLMVAADQSDHSFAVGLHIDHRLDEIRCRKVQKRGDFLDGPFSRGFDPAGGFAPGCGYFRFERGRNLRFFDIGGVGTLVACGNFVFARGCENLKLVAQAAPDRTRIGLDGPKLQPASGKDPFINGVHLVIFSSGIVGIGVKRVPVLHQELPAAHQAEARPDLVAKLGLYLIEILGQIPVGTDFSPNQIRDDFFMGRAEAEFTIVSVANSQ